MKITYLAVGKGKRKPKAVPASHIGYYQANSRFFYEAADMTAAEAREAIKEGRLEPTWVNGKRKARVQHLSAGIKVVEPVHGARLGDVLAECKAHGMDCVLRIGRDIYTPHYSHPRPGEYGSRPAITWHKVGPSGWTYDEEPISDIQDGASFEAALLADGCGRGAAMGAFWVVAQAGMPLKAVERPDMQSRVVGIMGRKFRIVRIVEGDRIEACDKNLETWQ